MYKTAWHLPKGAPSQALIFLHGRGQSHAATLSIANTLVLDNTLLVLPCAPEQRWYPASILSDIADNEPSLGASISYLDKVIGELLDTGLTRRQIVMAGFSQGAALASEYVGRGGAVKALIAFSGGRLGPWGTNWRERAPLSGIQMLFSVATRDPFVPSERVRETASHFAQRGAIIQLELFDEDEHCVRQSEYNAARALLAQADSEHLSTRSES
jgi:phospholipase/carboxylesterase